MDDTAATALAGVSGAAVAPGYSALYIDMAYTHAKIIARGQETFFETRHNDGFFERVIGVHPIADIGGSEINGLTQSAFSDRQTIIEGVAFQPGWPRFLAPLNVLQSQATLVRLLARKIREEKIDIIITTDPFYGGVIGRILKRRTGRPLAVGIYAEFDFAHEKFGFIAMPRIFPWYWLQNWVARWVLRGTDLIIGGARPYLEYGLRRRGKAGNGVVVSFARNVQTCHFSPPKRRGDPKPAFARHGIPATGRHMIMISRLIDVKFAKDGVAAMIEVAKKDNHAIGIVAGDGAMRSELEQLVTSAGLADRIIFAGVLTQDELCVIAPHCVNVSPFTGMSLVEAGLGGSPAVAYDADWQPDFVKDGVNGYVVPLGDYLGLARRTLELLGNEPLRMQMGNRMRERALSAADRGMIARLEREVFSKVLDGHEYTRR